LASEGLFDPQLKRPLPRYPKKVAIITAPQGAAVRDFINIYSRRSIFCHILVVPALVQGDKAPESLLSGLEAVLKYNKKNNESPIEVVVLARGGGSLEDLWAFNDEKLARRIFKFPIPTISAVGHEVDFTIADFVADMRCETPSAAAEKMTEAQVDIIKEVNKEGQRLFSAFSLYYKTLLHRLAMTSHESLLNILLQKTRNFHKRLDLCNLRHRHDKLLGIHDKILRIEDAYHSINSPMNDRILELKGKISAIKGVLHALDPHKVLDRGYTLIKNRNGDIIVSAAEMKKQNQDHFKVVFHDDEIEVRR